MARPKTLDKLTGAAWRDAKKAAGVKGAGFFDGRSGKAVADKIDDYQKKLTAYTSKKDKSTAADVTKALGALATALSAAQKDREFTTDLAKEFKGSIDALIADAKSEEKNLTASIKQDQDNDEKAKKGTAGGTKGPLAEIEKIHQFTDILKSKSLLKLYEEHCKKAYVSESFNFLMAVLNKTDRAKIIAEYVDQGSKQEINIDAGIRQHIQGGGDLRPAITAMQALLKPSVETFKTSMRQKYAPS